MIQVDGRWTVEAGKAQDDIEEIDGERLPSVEAHNSQTPSKKPGDQV